MCWEPAAQQLQEVEEEEEEKKRLLLQFIGLLFYFLQRGYCTGFNISRESPV